MARIAGVNIPNEKRIEAALPYIYGIGLTLSKKILDGLGVCEGDEVEVLSENGCAIIKKSQKNTQLSMPFSSRPKLGGARRSK